MRFRTSLCASAGLAVLAGGLGAAPALAQAGDDEDARRLGAVTVTAQRV